MDIDKDQIIELAKKNQHQEKEIRELKIENNELMKSIDHLEARIDQLTQKKTSAYSFSLFGNKDKLEKTQDTLKHVVEELESKHRENEGLHQQIERKDIIHQEACSDLEKSIRELELENEMLTNNIHTYDNQIKLLSSKHSDNKELIKKYEKEIESFQEEKGNQNSILQKNQLLLKKQKGISMGYMSQQNCYHQYFPFNLNDMNLSKEHFTHLLNKIQQFLNQIVSFLSHVENFFKEVVDKLKNKMSKNPLSNYYYSISTLRKTIASFVEHYSNSNVDCEFQSYLKKFLISLQNLINSNILNEDNCFTELDIYNSIPNIKEYNFQFKNYIQNIQLVIFNQFFEEKFEDFQNENQECIDIFDQDNYIHFNKKIKQITAIIMTINQKFDIKFNNNELNVLTDNITSSLKEILKQSNNNIDLEKFSYQKQYCFISKSNEPVDHKSNQKIPYISINQNESHENKSLVETLSKENESLKKQVNNMKNEIEELTQAQTKLQQDIETRISNIQPHQKSDTIITSVSFTETNLETHKSSKSLINIIDESEDIEGISVIPDDGTILACNDYFSIVNQMQYQSQPLQIVTASYKKLVEILLTQNNQYKRLLEISRDQDKTRDETISNKSNRSNGKVDVMLDIKQIMSAVAVNIKQLVHEFNKSFQKVIKQQQNERETRVNDENFNSNLMKLQDQEDSNMKIFTEKELDFEDD